MNLLHLNIIETSSKIMLKTNKLVFEKNENNWNEVRHYPSLFTHNNTNYIYYRKDINTSDIFSKEIIKRAIITKELKIIDDNES